MYEFSQGSKEKILTLHPDLQFLLHKAIIIFDFAVSSGHRGETEQNQIFEKGFSQLRYPKSKHNKRPSMAVDIEPYPIDYENRERYYFLAGIIKSLAIEHNIKLIWGGNWSNDNNFAKNGFDDLAHFQLG